MEAAEEKLAQCIREGGATLDLSGLKLSYHNLREVEKRLHEW